jgi:hypothetical protein
MLAAHYGIMPGTPEYYRVFFTSQGKLQASPNPLKPGNTVRQDLIDLGDITRGLYQDVWVDDCKRRGVESGLEFVLVPDVRYRNELKIMDLTIWVGQDTPGEHPTESQLTSKDFSDHLRFQQDTVVGRLQAIRRWAAASWGGLDEEYPTRAAMCLDDEERVTHE